jgi:peptidoglycan/xylan/chitin deacetylase (PgdA/CDA1 family)
MQTSVLMYHSIDDSSSVVSISPTVFEWQMRWISDHGYQVLPLRQVVEKIKNGVGFPQTTISITFDDGYESVYQNAFPTLVRFGFPATIFLVSGYVGQINNWPGQPTSISQLTLANWDQIREMDQHNIEFGSHTISHPRLDQIPLEDARVEICNSKTIIEQKLGHAIDLFAFPYGKYNPTVLAEVENFYAGACSTELGLVSSRSKPFELERLEMFYLRDPLVFRSITRPLLNPYLSTRRWLRALTSNVLKRQW